MLRAAPSLWHHGRNPYPASAGGFLRSPRPQQCGIFPHGPDRPEINADRHDAVYAGGDRGRRDLRCRFCEKRNSSLIPLFGTANKVWRAELINYSLSIPIIKSIYLSGFPNYLNMLIHKELWRQNRYFSPPRHSGIRWVGPIRVMNPFIRDFRKKGIPCSSIEGGIGSHYVRIKSRLATMT